MARARLRQRYRRGAVVGLLVTTIVLVGAAFARTQSPAPGGADLAGVVAGTPATPPADDPWPQEGSGDWRYAQGKGEKLGSEGKVRRFQVAVEEELELDVAEVAATVEAILADPRGWTAGGKHRFQRVAEDADADFTVFLATPGSSEEMCAAGGFHTDRFTSCRLPGEVVINVARWQYGVPDYGAPLDEYRAFAINHEVGHELGSRHEGCPGPGRAAPVMQPQTLGLHGCTANGWPYLRGSRYRGPKIP